MTEMDWPITEESIARSAETAERGKQVAERLFEKDGDLGDALHIIERTRRVVPMEKMRSSWTGRRGTIIAAICGAAALIYASAVYFPPRSKAVATAKLPSAASSAAAVVSLPPPNLLRPLSPDEAAKENAERPFVNRPDTAASRFVLRTDADDRDRALTCLTQAVYYEAASEGVDGGRAVAQVVLNRMRHPGYPASVCGVVYQGSDRPSGCQFTFTCDGSLLRAPVELLWTRSRKIAQEALAGRVFAPIGHATHYHADYVLPYWADSLDKTIQIGRHIFYRLPSVLGDGRSFFQRYAGTEPVPPRPGDALVVAPAAVTEQLASALISDGLTGAAKEAEKAAPAPSSPLLIDSSRGTLLADGAGGPAPTQRRKISTDCPVATSDGKQLAPIGANDVRSGISSSTC